MACKKREVSKRGKKPVTFKPKPWHPQTAFEKATKKKVNGRPYLSY